MNEQITGWMDMKTGNKKQPIDLGTLIENGLKPASIGAYYALPLNKQLQPKTLAQLENRLAGLIEKINKEPGSVLAQTVKRSFGTVTGAETILSASIIHNNYEAVAKQLASTIEGKQFDEKTQSLRFLKGEAFLSYFMKNTKDDNEVRLPKQTISMMAEQFSREFEALSKSLENRLPKKEDWYSCLEYAYGKNCMSGKDIQTLIEERLKQQAAFPKPGI